MKHISIITILLLAVFSLSAQTVQIGSWKTDEFTKTYTEKTWDFSQNISAIITKSGTYNIVFTFTGGGHKLCLKEAVIKADGKEVLAVAGERSAGYNPQSISYTFELGAVPKKLTLTAKARTDGGTNSNGRIELTVSDVVGGILTIPEGTTEIKNNAYYGNTALKKVIIPNTVTRIGNLAFHSCENLEEIDIPGSVKTIGDAAFQNCTALSKVTLHEGLSKINLKAFKNTAITEITIPSSVTEFGSELFNDCKNLTAIKVDKYSEAHSLLCRYTALTFTDKKPNMTEKQFLDKYNDKRDIVLDKVLYIRKGITEIKANAYYGAKYFTKAIIPDTVTQIGGCAFFASSIREVVIPSSVKRIMHEAFYCSQLVNAVLEEGVEQFDAYSFYTYNKLNIYVPDSVKVIPPKANVCGVATWTVVHGSFAHQYAKDHGFGVKIDWTKPYSAYSGDKVLKFPIEDNIPSDYFKHCPNLKSVDVSPKITNILPGTFSKNVTLRVKRNTYGDKWCRENGYYLCGVLADLSTYTKDKSKRIEEDFTRILCDDSPFVEWTSHKFKIQEPLKLEEVDNKLVLTSFMLKPCKNVTVTDNDGKTLIKNKTIQPLTRTVLCDFDFLTDDIKDWTLTTDDELYKRLASIRTVWTVQFSNFIRRASTPTKDNFITTMAPVFCREYIGGIFNVAWIIGSDEYEKRCYEAVKNKELVTDKELSVPLTKEQMDKLLKQARKWGLVFGRDTIAGTGGGNWLSMTTDFILGFAEGGGGAFWHEFSHCMGWGHHHGNMCNGEIRKPYGSWCWQNIGGNVYREEYKKGNTPYTDNDIFRSKFFSSSELHPPKYIDDDVIKDGILYVNKDMPRIDSQKNNTNFTKVVIPPSVEIISNSAFYGTRLNEISIPSSVTKIENLAFHNCVYIKNIDIPDTVKSVGDAAFQNCTSLESVKIGKGMRQLNYRLFKSTALRKVTIPKNIKYIGKEAFAGCRSLTSITIENGVRKIGDNAFDGTAIMELTIPESVTMIGKNITSKYVVWDVKEGSYAYKFALENNIPIKKDNGTLAENAARILNESKNAELAPNDIWLKGTFTSSNVRRRWDFSDYLNKGEGGTCTITFTYTSGRHGFDITDALFTADGKGIAYFPEKRFAGHSPSKFYYTVKVPKGTKKFEMFALARGDGGIDSNGTITVNNPDLRKLVIPPSTEVIKSSFYFGSNFEEVILPQGLKKIENNAFQNCPNLKSIDIPDSVTEMGSAVFQYCSSLETAKIGSGIKKINNTMFNHSGLKNVYLSDSLTGIGKEAFANCENFAEITIPNAVTDIGDSAFQNCVSLKKAKIGTGITALNASVFKNTGLTDITIPDNVTVIGSQAFQNCKNLKKVEIGSSVTKIDKSAFEKTAIEAINIPDTVTDVGKNAFSSCASLTTAKLSKGLTELSSAVFQSSGLKEITIPKNVVTVADKAFQNCKDLKKGVIGSGVTKIGKSAFEKTSLTNITIPKNVELIDEKAFQDCKSLEKVIIENGVKQIGWKAFNGTAIKEIKIPASVKSIGQSIVPKNTYWDVEPGTYAYKFAMDNKFLIKPSEKEVKEKTAQILQQSSDIESAPSDKWAKDMFTKSDVLRKWDFSYMLDGEGRYTVTFTYTSGKHKLCLTESLFIADGKGIAYFKEMRSAGSNPREIVLSVEVPAGTTELELYALARCDGGSESNGVIKVVKEYPDMPDEDDEDSTAETEDLSLLNDGDEVELPTEDDDEADGDDEEEE